MLITLTLNAMAFNLTYGFTSTIIGALGGGTEKVILSQKGSKAVYTGRVPLSLSNSLNKMEGVEAQPSTLTPTTIKGAPIVFRGVASISEYEDCIIEGEKPKDEGPWFMVGKKAFEKLNLAVGQIVPVCSPRSPTIFLLKLVAVYKAGGLRDWEAVLPLEYGRMLTNLPKGTTSILEVEGMEKEELQEVVAGSHDLTLNYDLEGGRIHILDSTGLPVESVKTDAPGTKSMTLPFGYYGLVYQNAYQTSNLTSLLLKQDTSVNLGFSKEARCQLKVLTPRDAPPVLRLQDGATVDGTWQEDAWLLQIPGGLHELEVGGITYQIQLVEDTVFNPITAVEELHHVTLKVYSQEGYGLKDYVATVMNDDGEVLFSTRSPNPSIKLLLPRGVYEVEVMKPPYKASAALEVPGEAEVSLKLPTLLKPSKIPLSLYNEVEAYTQTERSDASFSLMIGLSTGALLASTMTVFALSMIAVVTVQKGIYNASKENIHLLTQLGAGRLKTLRLVGIPTLITSLGLGFLAAWISLRTYTLILKPLTVLLDWISLQPLVLKPLTSLGYGITIYPTLTLVYSVSLGAFSWVYSNLRLYNWVAD